MDEKLRKQLKDLAKEAIDRASESYHKGGDDFMMDSLPAELKEMDKVVDLTDIVEYVLDEAMEMGLVDKWIEKKIKENSE